MFVDRAELSLTAGRGGNGSASFRREKFVPRGGPDGGDGGNGGNVVLVADPRSASLVDYKFQRKFVAQNGQGGSGKKCTGRTGEDLRLPVPVGTLVKTFPDERVIADLDREGMELIIVRGGRGGRGNFHFRSSVNRAPKRCEKGETGETTTVVLELKLIAAAGLVGLPNAGKSTLISKISGAKPKIADYPFTTLSPNLGVVYEGTHSLVVADIPGLIEGAHLGLGMGLEFLRHVERTRVLVILIDVSPWAEHTPVETFHILESELAHHKTELLAKRWLVAANKIDLVSGRPAGLAALKGLCTRRHLPYVEMSAAAGTNLDGFRRRLFALADES